MRPFCITHLRGKVLCFFSYVESWYTDCSMTTPPPLIPLRIRFGTPMSVYIGLSEAFLSFNGPMVVHTTAYYLLFK